jgi:cell wall-associated NlpC family hydrolase
VYLPVRRGTAPHISQSEIQPGDLIFYKSPIGHVAIYIGGGSMIHAPATGQVVTVAAVNWAKVVGIGRPG